MKNFDFNAPRPQRPHAHAAAAVLPRARERGARAREPREALVHPAHGAVGRGRAASCRWQTVALRTALIWHDEVMDDVVLEQAERRSRSARRASRRSSCPSVGLPRELRDRAARQPRLPAHARRAHARHDLHRRQGEGRRRVRRSAATATASAASARRRSAASDWGVIDLDETGDYKLFFQFVPVEDAQPFFTPPRARRRAGRLRARDPRCSPAAATVQLPASTSSTCRLLDYGCSTRSPRRVPRLRDRDHRARDHRRSPGVIAYSKTSSSSQPSLAFSVLLHARAARSSTYQLYDGEQSVRVAGPRA